eukprot:SAG11_NODE_5438_length_1560_cov_1.119097_2_plen_89_part_01
MLEWWRRTRGDAERDGDRLDHDRASDHDVPECGRRHLTTQGAHRTTRPALTQTQSAPTHWLPRPANAGANRELTAALGAPPSTAQRTRV